MKKLEIELVCCESVSFDDKKQTEFNLAMSVITLLYEQILRIKNSKIDKLRFDLFDETDIYNIFEPSEIGKICHIDKSFNFDNYFSGNKFERRKIILETLYTGIKDMCKRLNYDLEPFTIAYEKVKELNYINKFMYKKLTFSRNRKYKAGIEIETNETEAIISVLFTDKNEKFLHKTELIKTWPHYIFIYRVIHKGKWISLNEYQVSDRSGQINFVVELSENPKKRIVFKPVNASKEKLKDYLEKSKINGYETKKNS